jgi:hypothetical protein
MVTRSVDYQLIFGQLYKLRVDGILCRCVLDHEWDNILYESHERIGGGCNADKAMIHKVLHVGLWWSLVLAYAKEYYK